jgi:hypothetical protein
VSPEAPDTDTPREDAAPARDRLERASPGDTGSALRLVAALLLDGEEDRARVLAARLLEEGALSGGRPDAARGRARRALELLTGIWPDPDAALAALGERPDSHDIAWPVARALALARAGESAEAADAFEELARALRRGAGLDVRRVRFARRVDGFGVYEVDARRAFRPGESLLVYAEVEGFVCEPARAPRRPGGAEEVEEVKEAEGVAKPRGEADTRPPPRPEEWRVRLEVRVSLENRLTGEAGPAWDVERVEHVTRAAVRDLHVTRLVRLPADLAPGEYELKLGLRDLGTGGTEGLGLRRFVVEER